MKVLVFLCLVAAAVALPKWREPLSDDMIDYINNLQTTWKAGPNFDYLPHNMRYKYVKKMCGTILPTPEHMRLPLGKIEIVDDVPDTFDARKEWPKCKSIKEVRDQSNCGSCWAFGAVESMSDRICISSKQQKQVHISAENLNSCCDSCGNGCGGGFPSAAWDYFVQIGLVTGGQYGTKQGCQPYSLKHCDHHTTGKYQPCQGDAPTPPCKSTCESSYNTTYSNDLHFGQTSGPVEAAFSVYADFPSYKSGVYQHETGELLGGHAVKILGWGTEEGTPYWLVANSWNEDWGLKGFFKILRGQDECGIESEIVAGDPMQ
ncbi:hypothetical protein ScPMuIL_007922 [Solemya velum]